MNNNNNNTKAAHIHELSGVPTMHAHEAADPASSVPHKIAATDKNNIFLFSVATSDSKVQLLLQFQESLIVENFNKTDAS